MFKVLRIVLIETKLFYKTFIKTNQLYHQENKIELKHNIDK